ncbi:Ras-related protein Rap1 [Gryllus bimaculatus]|nr:Ras-related protein Rap1 [Gryllus bimaculatus]
MLISGKNKRFLCVHLLKREESKKSVQGIIGKAAAAVERLSLRDNLKKRVVIDLRGGKKIRFPAIGKGSCSTASSGDSGGGGEDGGGGGGDGAGAAPSEADATSPLRASSTEDGAGSGAAGGGSGDGGASPSVPEQVPKFKVAMLGASGVGKTALACQFTTSEYICAYDTSLDEEGGQKTVSVLLDGREAELEIIDYAAGEMPRRSLRVAEDIVRFLWKAHYAGARGVILVGNKADLERRREVSTAIFNDRDLRFEAQQLAPGSPSGGARAARAHTRSPGRARPPPAAAAAPAPPHAKWYRTRTQSAVPPPPPPASPARARRPAADAQPAAATPDEGSSLAPAPARPPAARPRCAQSRARLDETCNRCCC